MVLLPADGKEFTEEIRDAAPAHLLTKINSFSLLSENKIREVEAMEFEAGDYKWKVKINLNEGEQISVNLSMVGTNSLPAGWEVNAIFAFFVYNHISDKYHCFRGKARRFHAIHSEWGFSNLMTKESLTEPSSGYIFKDKCVFGAEVFVIKKQTLIEEVSVLKSAEPYKQELKISEFSKLETIWSSEEFSAGGYKWTVQIYRNGNKSARDRYISIFLECVDAKSFDIYKKVNVSCDICFKNQFIDEQHHCKTAKMLYTSTNPSWGVEKFILIGDMKDPSKGFVVDDCCNLELLLSIRAIHEASHTAVI